MFLQNKIQIGDVSGQGYAEISNCKIFILKTFVGYRLQFDFTISPFQPFPNTNTNYPTLVGLNVDLALRETHSALLLGRMIDSLRDDLHLIQGNEFSITKYFEIRADDFARLIDRSHRSDVILELTVRPILSGAPHEGKGETGVLKIPQSDWIQRINSLDLDRFELITIRIPVSSSHLHSPFVEALAKIREAEQQYLRGDWNGACSSCRAAWRTVLSTAPKNGGAIEHLLARVNNDPRRRKFAVALTKGLHDIQNAAAHLEGDVKTGVPSADVSAEDALLCLHWYSAIIGYLSGL